MVRLEWLLNKFMKNEIKIQSDQEEKDHKWRRMLLFLPVLILGVSIIIFGGYDDSPGAQGIGLLITLIGFWKLIIRKKIWRRKTKE